MYEGGDVRDEHRHACTRQDKEIQKHEGEADNIVTIQASTVAQQVHATRAREAQARGKRKRAALNACRSIWVHVGGWTRDGMSATVMSEVRTI